jgi:hypothetical protein
LSILQFDTGRFLTKRAYMDPLVIASWEREERIAARDLLMTLSGAADLAALENRRPGGPIEPYGISLNCFRIMEGQKSVSGIRSSIAMLSFQHRKH